MEVKQFEMPDGSKIWIPKYGEEWKLVKTITIDEPVTSVRFNTGDDGNPFEVEEVFVYGKNVKTDSATQGLLLFNQYYSTSLNDFFNTTAKSFFIYSSWKGVRFTESMSSTYDLTMTAQSGASSRIVTADNVQKITALGIRAQVARQFTSGTMYFYAR